MRTCTVPGCKTVHYGLGLCRLHYRRKVEGKHGLTPSPCRQCKRLIEGRKIEAEFCSVACQHRWERAHGCYRDRVAKRLRGACTFCSNPVHARQMCRGHYMRDYRARL